MKKYLRKASELFFELGVVTLAVIGLITILKLLITNGDEEDEEID